MVEALSDFSRYNDAEFGEECHLSYNSKFVNNAWNLCPTLTDLEQHENIDQIKRVRQKIQTMEEVTR